MSSTLTKTLIVTALGLIFSVLAQDWIPGLAVFVLWGIWHYIPQAINPPVIALALTHQWVQIVLGIFYFGLTQRRVPAMDLSDYRPMVLIGLGCLMALALGLLYGMRLLRMTRPFDHKKVDIAFSWRTLILAYALSLGLIGITQELAWQIPALTQGILVMTFVRFGLLYLIFNRLMNPEIRYGWVGIVLLTELLLGFTGFFAGFREGLMMAVLALLTRNGRWQMRQSIAFGALAAMILLTGLIWMGIKGEYRYEITSGILPDSGFARLERIGSLTSEWFSRGLDGQLHDLDRMVDRLWAVYYPALAVSMVPDIVPHEHGKILWGAVRHIFTPRILFQEKEALESDSEMVRRYTGVRVAGEQQGTSIAFGYAVESYVDFGVPLMFLPVFVYGLLMGAAYAWIIRQIRHRELAIGVVSVLFWIALYLFERSWIKTLGLAGTLIIVLGGTVYLVDRFLLYRRGKAYTLLRTSEGSVAQA